MKHTMNAPLVSFCIPTYNRSRYLNSLLTSLVDELAAFPYAYEVFISDNASPDDTQDTVRRFTDKLPIRYMRHDANRGGGINYQYLMAEARGRYVMYVADDDLIIGQQVTRVIKLMEADPKIGIAYAPWKLLDLVTGQNPMQFYKQDDDVLIRQGQFKQLLDILLQHSVFPEISISRREVLQAVMPRVHEQAFFAFVHAAEFAQRSSVLLLKEPFYISVTNYFADHQRTQAGHGEAEYAWDRYRGGLEYVLGRAMGAVSEKERADFCLRIQAMITDRIAVAVRLRLAAKQDPIETYYLAYRLKAMNAERFLPVDMHSLCALAAFGFFLSDPELNRGINKQICFGSGFDSDHRTYIESMAKLPLSFVESSSQLRDLDESTLILGCGAATVESLPAGCKSRFVHVAVLLSKFPA